MMHGLYLLLSILNDGIVGIQLVLCFSIWLTCANLLPGQNLYEGQQCRGEITWPPSWGSQKQKVNYHNSQSNVLYSFLGYNQFK